MHRVASFYWLFSDCSVSATVFARFVVKFITSFFNPRCVSPLKLKIKASSKILSVQPAFLHDLNESLLAAFLLCHEKRNVASLS